MSILLESLTARGLGLLLRHTLVKQDLLRQPYAAELERRCFAFSVDLLRSSIFLGAVVPAFFSGSPKIHKP